MKARAFLPEGMKRLSRLAAAPGGLARDEAVARSSANLKSMQVQMDARLAELVQALEGADSPASIAATADQLLMVASAADRRWVARAALELIGFAAAPAPDPGKQSACLIIFADSIRLLVSSPPDDTACALVVQALAGLTQAGRLTQQ